MDFSLSEEQEMLRKMARDFLAEKVSKAWVRQMDDDEKGYSPDLWLEMAGLGWMGLIFPEQYGGGMTFLDLAVLLEEMGRSCLPGPFFSTVVLAGLTILEAANDKQKKDLLPRLARGDLIATLALTEPSAQYDASSITVTASPAGDGYVLDGIKLFVPDAHIAHYIICVARTRSGTKPEEGITLFLVDARSPGLSCTLLKSLAGKQCEVSFNKVKVPRENILGSLDHGWPAVEKVLRQATVARCMEMVGGAQQVLDMSVSYAKERVQFDRPIGSFQVIQHYCANMATDVDGSRFVAYQAAWMISQGLPCTKEAAVAKAWVSEAYRRVTALGQQIHGGMGFSLEHDMPLYFKRAKSAELTFGGAEFHRETVAREMGL